MNAESANPKAGAAETIFNAALAFNAAERAAYVAGACGDNHVMRQRVEALLRAHEAPQGFLPDQPARAAPKSTMLITPISEAAGTVIGRYKLLQQIGEGGCGVVYMAEQQEPVRRRVALKVIKLGMDTKQVIARFEAERQALALMDHPNIAKVLDAGATETGRPYFVMELVKGVPITRYCDEKSLSASARLELFIQVCHAVQHAHQKGIIHRDLKPSNVLVADHDGVPIPKIIDFGIAKATTDQPLTNKTLFTAFEQFIGTPAYMSPEQANLSGLDIDTRSDIYSLGVLLYELLTGKTPFDAKRLLVGGLDEIRRIILEEEPSRPSIRLDTLEAAEQTTVASHRQSDPSKLVHLLRGDLDWIVMKALEKDRARRYETATGLAADLRRHLNHEAVVARPPGQLYRLQKLVRRNRLVCAAVAAVALALIAGLGIATWAFFRERQALFAEKSLHYASDMDLAQQDWEQNDLPRLREVLSETRDFPGRSFEWYYWQRQTHQSFRTFHGRYLPLSSVAFFPDGKRVIAGGFMEADVWDVATGAKLFSLPGHTNSINAVAVSADGRRIATAGQDGTARIWDAADGKELLGLGGHTNEVRCVAFSPDARRVVTGGDDSTAQVWDASTGKELLKIQPGSSSSPAWVTAVSFSLDGRRVLTVDNGSRCCIWDAASGDRLSVIKGPAAARLGISGFCLALAPDGRSLFLGSTLWDVASGTHLATMGPQAACVAFSPDSQWAVLGTVEGIARVWDLRKNKEWLTFNDNNFTAGIVGVAFSPDGRCIAAASADGFVKLYDATAKPDPFLVQASGSVTLTNFAVDVSPDLQRMAVGNRDATCEVWDTADGKHVVTLAMPGHAGVLSVKFSPDGRRLVTGNNDSARVWDAQSGRLELTLNHANGVHDAAFSADGRWILTGGFDRAARLWDAVTGRELRTFSGGQDEVTVVAFSGDGRRIVTGNRNGSVRIWDTAKGKELLALDEHMRGDCQVSVALSPDGSRLATTRWDDSIHVWDVRSGRQILVFHGASFANTLAFSPDGRRILSGGHDNTAKLSDAVSGQELLSLRASISPLLKVAFSADGRRLFAGSLLSATFWEAAAPEQVAAWQEEERSAIAGLRMTTNFYR